MKDHKIIKILILIAIIIFSAPFFALAVNDVSISDDTNFELNTSDTAVLTTIVAEAGGQATNFDVQSNYIDITLDNLSSVTFSVAAANRYFTITQQSGSTDYTISPACPTTSVTLSGTGATVVLRLEVQTTDSCVTPPPPSGGGGGGSSGSVPFPTPTTAPTDCQPGDTYSRSTGQLCPTPTDCQPGDTYSRSTGQLCPVPPTDCQPGYTYSPSTGQLCPAIIYPTPSPSPSPTPTPTQAFFFTRNLSLGSTGADVRALQIYLNNHGFTVSLTGPGSRGQESIYFGLKTKAALTRFQEFHRAEILTPIGLYYGTGIFGPSTRAYVNSHI